MSPIDFAALDRHWNCRLSVRGRKTGQERTVTIWYALDDCRILLAGSPEEPQWCRNLRANPDVVIRIGSQRIRGRARVVEDAALAARVRDAFVRRYLLARLSRPFGGYTRSTPVVVEQLAPA